MFNFQWNIFDLKENQNGRTDSEESNAILKIATILNFQRIFKASTFQAPFLTYNIWYMTQNNPMR